MMKTLPKQVSRVLVYAIFSAFTAAPVNTIKFKRFYGLTVWGLSGGF